MKKAQLGSVSHATMRPQDLIPAFLDTLSGLAGNEVEHKLLTDNEISKGFLLEALENEDLASFWDSDDAHYLLESLFEALGDLAPDHCYFGAHEGDGSDYGFWPSWDSLQDDPDVMHCGDGRNDKPLPEHVLHTNDHGNATLYKVTLTPVWDCV